MEGLFVKIEHWLELRALLLMAEIKSEGLACG